MPTKTNGAKTEAVAPKRPTKTPSQPAKPVATTDAKQPDSNPAPGQPTERQSQLATILIGLLIIASGLLIYNYFQNSPQPTVKTTDEQANHTVTSSPSPTVTSTPTHVLKEKTSAKPSATPTPKPTSNPSVNKQGQYTVVAGDSLWSIAEKIYGSGFNWNQIAQANQLPKDQNGSPIVEVGQVLNVPNSAAQTSAPAQTSQPSSSQAVGGTGSHLLAETPQTAIQSYVVKRGDTLWGIAQATYGDGQKWTLIFNDPHNNLGKLPDGTPLIHAGNELYLPDNPAGP